MQGRPFLEIESDTQRSHVVLLTYRQTEPIGSASYWLCQAFFAFRLRVRCALKERVRNMTQHLSPAEPARLGYWEATITGGVRRVCVEQLALAWWSHQRRHITARQLQLYWALHEMDERRRMCSGQNRKPHYAVAEARALLGNRHSERTLKRDLSRLEELGLVQFEKRIIRIAAGLTATRIENAEAFQAFVESLPHRRRVVPVPRRMIRALAAGLPTALVSTIVALLIRGAFWHRSEKRLRLDGRVKASWITSRFGISLRAVKSARRTLEHMGWITILPSNQWELNRFGLHYLINCDWQERECAASGSAPPNYENTAKSAPPCTKQVASTRRDTTNRSLTSVDSKQVSEAGESPPKLHDLKPADLASFPRVLSLYEQAVRKGLAQAGEGGRLDFIALVERATTHGREAIRLFSWLLHRKRFNWISDADEDRARSWMRYHAEGRAGRRKPEAAWPLPASAWREDADEDYFAALNRRNGPDFVY